MVKRNSDAQNRSRTQRPTSEVELGRFVDRLREAIGTRSVRGFARDCGISESVMRAYVAGRSEPGRQALLAMAEEADVTVEWLVTGRGPKRMEDWRRLQELEIREGAPPREIDTDLLEDIIYAVRRVLSDISVALPPAAEAKVVRLLYELYSQRGGDIETSTVGKVIDLALYRQG